jgi:hypothetical protein
LTRGLVLVLWPRVTDFSILVIQSLGIATIHRFFGLSQKKYYIF